MTQYDAQPITSQMPLSSMISADAQSNTRAWLLPYAPSRYFALPLQACNEVIEMPEIMRVPGIATYGAGLISWRDQWLPLIDMNALITRREVQSVTEHYCVIVSYYNENDVVDFAALSLYDFPRVIDVLDDDICALPSDFPWKTIATSCFRHMDSRVPIVDGSKLFTKFHG